jgi:sugar lactone lactonase YvrE
MMPLPLEAIPHAELGEGPSWDAKKKKMYFVDILANKIIRYDPKTLNVESCTTSSYVGFVVPDPDNDDLVIAGLQDGIYKINFDTGEEILFAQPETGRPENRFNDGKTDSRGRIWAGTMHLNPRNPVWTGSLYRIDSDGTVTTHATNIGISNGLGWSPDDSVMYYSDTSAKTIWVYDYDIETGTPSNKRVFVKIPEGQGSPDGLTVDDNGNVWLALWGGSCVNCYSPEAQLLQRIELPVPQPSSCAFGGEDLQTLYITTARLDLSDEELQQHPLSGKVFTYPFKKI